MSWPASAVWTRGLAAAPKGAMSPASWCASFRSRKRSRIMSHPYVTIDVDKIEHNARTIVGLCRTHGIAVVGVTKCTCGFPEIAKAMLRGGVVAIGESQLENIHRLRSAGVDASYMLLRLPSLSEA